MEVQVLLLNNRGFDQSVLSTWEIKGECIGYEVNSMILDWIIVTSLIDYYSMAKYRRLRKIYVATSIVCPSLGALVDQVLHLAYPLGLS